MTLKQLLSLIPSGSCTNCGSLVLHKSVVCDFCFQEIYEQSWEGSEGKREFLPITLHAVRHRWAISWTNREDRWISNWAHLLKGSVHADAWAKQADFFIRHQGQELLEDAVITSPKPLIFIGPEKTMDHSYFWGKTLADGLGARHMPCLFLKKQSEDGDQKTLSLESRRMKALEVRPEYKKFILREKDDWQWVFADDVWTSGATANAAFSALGNPRFYQVVSFFRRFP